MKIAGKEGPVHDVQWSPSGLEFAVVYGCMPSVYLVSVVFSSFCLRSGKAIF